MQKENLDKHLSDKLYELFGRDLYAALESSADALGQELRVVGGTVRDLILDRPTSDFDFVTEGSGLLLAEQLKEKLGKRARVTLFRNFGTAQVKYRGSGGKWAAQPSWL